MKLSESDLERAVREGIITSAQRAQLHAIAQGDVRPAGERAPAIIAAYAAGAVTVLFAFGWFLVERWERLGPGGVLVLVLVYAAMFAAASWWLAREGFPLAASFAALLAVGMTPIAAWAVLRLTGFWDGDLYGQGSTRWAIVELTAALAALLAWRRTRFAPLALPVAIAGWLAPLHLARPFFDDPAVAASMFGRGSLVTGACLLLAGYVVDRRTAVAADARSGLAFDPAGWVYRVAVVALFAGVVATWDDTAVARHGTLVLALVGATFALALGRSELLAAAGAAFVAYLGYLAFDVFERVLSFPVVLATFGILLILITVMVQRRWPALSARLDAARAGERRLPGGLAIPASLLAATLILTVIAPGQIRERLARQHREFVRAVREGRATGTLEPAGARPLPRPAETPAERGP